MGSLRGSKLGAEALGESRDDSLPQGARILVRERPLGRLKLHAEGDRLLAFRNLPAAVDVEHAHLTELGAGSFACGGDEISGQHVFVDGECKILVKSRK